MHRFFVLLMAIGFFATACTSVDVFEKSVSFKKQEWPGSDKPALTFTISDTASLYNISLVIRHTDAYNYNNIWLKILRSGPDTSYDRQVDIRLASNSKGWLGTGMDDVWEHRIKINEFPVQFRKNGDYTFTIEQIMRQDPLLHVMNVGLRVEKVK